ncbi:hypothetical protein B0H12DRAFT_1239912 [Mycena haematopus]|nr:hypothetical protein B0H12DRAFT_1239912 [Mycena haematopus]
MTSWFVVFPTLAALRMNLDFRDPSRVQNRGRGGRVQNRGRGKYIAYIMWARGTDAFLTGAINEGPPSRIGRTSPDPPVDFVLPARRVVPVDRAAETANAGPTRSSTGNRAARNLANGVPRTPPRRTHDGGYRVPRRIPLTAEALYIDDARPPVLATPKPHHTCSICWSVKSHPVSYPCGHGHCFVCIRVWLEKHWTCPDCNTQMFMAPFRHYGEESSIAEDYPFWKDDSRVALSFSGLSFPRPPREVIVLDIEHSPVAA